MGFIVYITELVVFLLLLKDSRVDAQLIVSSANFTVTGVDLGLSIEMDFSGVSLVTCFADAEDSNAEIDAVELNTSPTTIEKSFDSSGYLDIVFSCFGDDDFYVKMEENFYIGDVITGINVTNNATGFTIPFDYPRVDDLDYEITFLTGTDVNITLELPHNGWSHEMTSVSNGTHTISIPASNFDTNGLYTLQITFINPLTTPDITTYVVLSLFEPVVVTDVVLKEYETSTKDPAYVMLSHEVEFEISLSAGDDLTFSLTVSKNDDVIAMKGSVCEGKTTLKSFLYRFNEVGEFNVTVDVSNYVSHYNLTIPVQVIYPYNEAPFDINSAILFNTDSATFDITLLNAANLPMGTVDCVIEYKDGSIPGSETVTFDWSASEFGSISKTTDSFTHTFVAGWFYPEITCSNQLPDVVDGTKTTKTRESLVKVVNLVENLEMTHDSSNASHHPFSSPITFTIKLIDPTADLPLANLSCTFDFDASGSGDFVTIDGDVTDTSEITYQKSFAGGRDYTISANCSNLLSFDIVSSQETFTIYFDCWGSETYFDAAYKTEAGALTSKTNEAMKIQASVRLTDVCNGTIAHFWSMSPPGLSVENITLQSTTTVINLPKYTYNVEGVYVFSLTIYFPDVTPIIPALADYIFVDYTFPDLVLDLTVDSTVNDMKQVWRKTDVVIDSSTSFDPASLESVPMTRIWECRTGVSVTENDVRAFIGSGDFSIWPMGATEDCSDILTPGADSFTIPAETLALTKWYILVLTLEHAASGRNAQRAQGMYGIDQESLSLDFRCLTNCFNGTSNSDLLTLIDFMVNIVVLTEGVQNSTMSYEWKVEMLDEGLSEYLDVTNELGASRKRRSTAVTSGTGFLFSREGMERIGGQQYTISCIVVAPNFATTKKSQAFTMNKAPANGTCSLSVPSTPVTASITELTFACSGWTDEHGDSLKYSAVQVFLTETNEANSSIPENIIGFAVNTKQTFKLLRPHDEAITLTRVQVWVKDNLGPPYGVFDLGDVEIKPALSQDASGDAGAAAVDMVFERNAAAFDSALKLNDLGKTSTIVQTLVDALPTNTPEEEPIAPPDTPDAGGLLVGYNEEGEPISSDDVFTSLEKKKEDPTTAKCKEMTAKLAGAVLSTATTQSEETKRDPTAQTGVIRAVQGLALQKKNVNTTTLYVMKDIVVSVLNNTKDIEPGTAEYDTFINGLITMVGTVAEAMSPDLGGAQGDVSQNAERKRSEAEAIFAIASVKEAVETGAMSENEMQFYKSRLGQRQKFEVDDRKSLCNDYSSTKTEHQKNIIVKAKISDGFVQEFGSADSNVAMTKDTSEQLANRTLTSVKSSVQIPGLAKAGVAKVGVAIFEQKGVAHLDNNEDSGGITSGESTLVIDTESELTDPILFTQKIDVAEVQTVQEILDPDDASSFTYFLVHVRRTYDDLNFNLKPDPDSDIQVKKFHIYVLYVENVDEIDSVFVSKADYTAKKEITGPHWTAQFPPNERKAETGVYKVGVETEVDEADQTSGSTRRKRSASNSTGPSFTFASATMACMTWDDSTNSWRTDECEGTWKPDTGELVCSCKPKKELTIANSFYVAPNKIDFSSVFLKFSPLNQAAVMATLLLVFLIYFLIVLWARRQDRKDLLKWGITPLSDNFSEDNYFYVIKVFTGMRPGAGTRSRVCMVVSGEEMDTGVRELADGVREEFSTGSVMNFLMSTTVYLGDLDYIRVWHDNSGSGSNASWYLSKVEIHDVQRNESFTFLGERWLAVEKEDGLLECILPVCKTENLNVFKNRFFLNAKDNLADSHIWISVAYRPQASNFTRTQRASCALMFVMLTMISNAMFFRSSNEDNYETPSELQVGPFRFSLQQVYISLICALIVTPPTLIVIYIFKLSKTRIDPNQTLFKPKDKASRYKIPFMNDWLEREQKRSMELERHLVQKGLPNSQTLFLPYWCTRLAWFIVFLATFLSAFFVMLYSMQWGRQKSEEWITTFLLSFFESVFCLDPVKVAIMAVIFALIFRSAKEGQAPVNRSTIMKKYSTNLRARSGGLRLPAPPLDERKLEKARNERHRDLLMKKAFRDIVVNILIIWILFSISFSNRDVRSYYMHQEVVDRLLKPANMPHFASIKTTADFMDWMNNTAIINSFPEFEKDANSTPLHWRQRQFIEGGSLFRVGPPRLRQLRTTKQTCKNSPYPTVDCYKKYHEATEETGSYCIGWEDGPCDPDETLYQYSSDAWRFTSALDIWGLPIAGYYTTYGGGGYIAELSVNRQVSQVIFNELYNNSWVDRQSRAVLFEFTLYCLNANIFTYNMFMVEFPETGAAFPYYVIFPMRVYLHQGPLGMYTLACEVLFVLYLIFLTVMIIMQMVQQKKDFFKQGWQVYELIFIILSYVAIAMNIVQFVFTDMSLDAFRGDKKAFVNFYHLAIWNNVLVLLIGVLVFMATVRMLNILGYNKRVNAVARVFTKAASDLLWFGIFFSYVFTCYAAFGYLLFGWKLKSYKNVFTTMGTLFISMIGKSRFTEIEETDPVFSKIYFMCFIFFVVYMILTMFLAVLAKAIDQVHSETKSDKSDEMVDYVIKKMKGLMSYGGGTKKGAVKPAPWNRENLDRSRKRRGMFNKTSHREILQEIRESMHQALIGSRRDFKTPDSEQTGRKVAFRH